MLPLNALRKALRHVRTPDALQLWQEVLVVAVTENSYSVDVQIRVLLDLKLRDYASLMEWADAMTQIVYGSPIEHYRMHQIAALIRKYPLSSELSGLDARLTARKTFHAAEHRCGRVNQRFDAIKSVGRDPDAVLMHHIRGYIRGVLSDAPNMDQIYKSCDITGGAAIGVHGNATNVARKISSTKWSVTPRAIPYALGAICENFHIVEYLLREETKAFICLDSALLSSAFRRRVSLVHYNKLSFVPKTAKTDRSIAVEPFLNSFLQKGIDSVMRIKLRRVGLDLSNQFPNQELARLGSLEDENPYCTIDLSSASDTMATEMVLDALPPLWGDLLDSVRCHYYVDEGVVRKYSKFVSMGNGFCFPLQSLIFAAVCHASSVMCSVRSDFRVYGDDIIVRRNVFESVVRNLRRLGFIPNPRKTFSEGPFRESCGTDWYAGVNVRPIYIDSPLDSWGRIYSLYNQSLRREPHVYDYFRKVRNLLLQRVPRSVRLLSYDDPRDILSEDETLEVDPWMVSTTIDGAFWVPLDVFMTGRYVGFNIDTQNWRYALLRCTARVDTAYRPGREGGDDLIFLIGALRGSDSRKPFTLRYSTQTKPVIVNDYIGS